MWDGSDITAVCFSVQTIPITNDGNRSRRPSDIRLLAFCASALSHAGYFRRLFRRRRIPVLRFGPRADYRASEWCTQPEPLLVPKVEIGRRSGSWSCSGVENVGMVRRRGRVFARYRLGNPLETF